jgi:hypothetical protein
MSSHIGEMDLQAAAEQAAGNWTKFGDFSWNRASELDAPGDWFITYTHHRDSGLLDQSNADAIERELQIFTDGDDPDVVAEHHHHWAVGWIEGWSIRVFRDGQITEAFRAYHELAQRLNDYPALDEEDYSRRQYEATLDNFADAAWRLKDEYDLPQDWESVVYDWFSKHDCAAIEDSDDSGAYPTEDQLRAAFDDLGFERMALVV